MKAMFTRMRESIRLRWLASSTLVACLAGMELQTVFAADIPVTSVNDSGAGTYRQGLSVANVGDRLVFDSLTSGSSLVNGSALTFNNGVTLLNKSSSAITLTDPHAYLLGVPLTVNWAGTLNLNGNLTDNGSNTGSLILTGAGTVALSGNNSYSGGTMFEGGTLQLLSNTGLGTGQLTVHGLGGSTTLDLGNGVTASNNIQLQNTLVVNVASGRTGTLAGLISESGGSNGLNTTGAGTLILSGANTFTGGVYVSGNNTIRLENNTALGSGQVTVAGGLTLDLANGINSGNHFFLENNLVTNVNSGTATLSGNITEAAPSSLTKTGAGTLILSGTNSYSGLTNIQNGGVQVSGSVAGNVLVANTQSTLSGAGSVGNVTNNGTVQPGNNNAIGDLTVNGNFTQNSGGTTQILVNSAGNTPGTNNGHLNISGHANLDGKLNIQAVGGGNYNTGTHYTILNAASGVSGQYSQVTSNLSLYSVNVTYDPNDVKIQLQETGSLLNSAVTNNQIAVAGALQKLSLTSSGALFDMINTLGSETPAQQRQAYNQLSGEQFGNTQTIALQTGDLFQQRITNRIFTSNIFLGGAPGSSTDDDPNSADNSDVVRGQSPTSMRGGWIQGYGSGGAIQSNNNGAGVRFSQGGGIYGMDFAADETGMIGVVMGNSYVGYHDGFGGGGQLTGYQVGLYALKQSDLVYALGTANYGYDNFGSNRNVLIGGINQTLTANYLGHQLGANVETGLKLDTPWVQVQPLMGLQYLYLSQQGFSESGGPAALDVATAHASALRSVLGARFISRQFVGPYGAVWTPYGQTRWAADLLGNDRLVNASINGAPAGATFTTAGTRLGTNYGIFTKGFQVQFNSQWSMFASIDVFVATRMHTETGTLGACYIW